MRCAMDADPPRHAWSMPVQRRPAAGMTAGAAALAIGVAAWLALAPLIHPQALFLFLIPAAVIASAFGGLLPGLVVAALGTALGLGFNGRLDAGNLLGAGLFLATAVAVAIGGEWFQRAWDRAGTINAELAEREAHLASILETIPDAMIVIDEAGLVRSFSQAAERLFDWRA